MTARQYTSVWAVAYRSTWQEALASVLERLETNPEYAYRIRKTRAKHIGPWVVERIIRPDW